MIQEIHKIKADIKEKLKEIDVHEKLGGFTQNQAIAKRFVIPRPLDTPYQRETYPEQFGTFSS